MDAGVIVLSVVVGLFGVASAVLGFIAEATKLTRYDIDVNVYAGTCDYPPNAAFVLSLIAVALLAVAEVIVSVANGCCGCCRPRHGASESKRVIGIISAIFSWIAALLTGGFYLNGALWNAPIERDETWCRLLKDGYFRLPALLSLAATALAIQSYIMLRAQAPTSSSSSTAPAPVAGGSEPGPDVPQEPPPPAGEAIAVSQEQLYANGHDQRQETFPDVPRHLVGGYGRASNPQRSRPPQRQAQPAFEVMMA